VFAAQPFFREIGVMYKKGAALELQFAPARLNDQAGDPYWIDLSADEARALHEALGAYLAVDAGGRTLPLVVGLDRAHEARGETATAAPAERVPAAAFKQWVCVICGWVYDEAAGSPEHGIAAGTRWEDVPADWRCPLCDVGKEDFALTAF
jgi:rubredoxin